MNSLLETGGKLLTKAMALKAGKFAWKRGGLLGVGIGAVAGAGYLAYHFITKKKEKEELELQERRKKEKQAEELRRIDNIDSNNPEVRGDKKIVI